jgi:hypothetical protein
MRSALEGAQVRGEDSVEGWWYEVLIPFWIPISFFLLL